MQTWLSKLAATVAAGVIVSSLGCSSSSSTAHSPNQASAPVFSVPAGAYASSQTVTITDATSGANIYYTTDGTAPTPASTLYAGPVTVSSSETLQAIAVANGYSNSAATSSAYVIRLSTGTLTGVVASSKPIAGAKVYLLTPGTGGYGQASLSLLSAAQTGHSDSVGAYVTTGPDGSFTLTGQFVCSAAQPVYLYVSGGDAGGGTNPAIGLMAALGGCPVAGTSVSAHVNEITTVAAAYALSGFATDATHISSSGTTLAKVGVGNAFATSTNLVDLSSGAALATTPAGNGTVPTALINTLGNLLASCVDTASSCSRLLSTATSDGTGSGAAPVDTATAGINIAHHPGLNVAALYPAASSSLYSPALGAQPRDFALYLSFTGGGLATMQGVAIDANGNVWTQDGGARISEFSPLGAAAFSNGIDIQQAASYSFSTVGKPIAIDLQGNAWMAAGQGVFEVSHSGHLLSPAGGYPGGGSTTADPVTSNDEEELAIDRDNNVWVSHGVQDIVTKLSNTGSLLSPAGGYAVGSSNQPFGLAATNAGTLLVGGSNQLVTLSSSGAISSTNPGCCGTSSLALDAQGNLWSTVQGATIYKTPANGTTQAVPFSSQGVTSDLAIDGAGNVWLPKAPAPAYAGGANYSSLIEISNSGAMLSPSVSFVTSTGTYTDYGFAYAQILPPQGIAVDGSGNVWLASYTPGSTTGSAAMVELVGIATPVVTPIVAGVQNGTLGMRP